MTLIINGKTYEASELIAYVNKLEKENAEAKEIIKDMYEYTKVFYPKADFTIKAEAFINGEKQ